MSKVEPQGQRQYQCAALIILINERYSIKATEMSQKLYNYPNLKALIGKRNDKCKNTVESFNVFYMFIATELLSLNPSDILSQNGYIYLFKYCNVTDKTRANMLPSMHISMMTPSNGNIFRVTGDLCGEFIGHRWKASDAKLWCFLLSVIVLFWQMLGLVVITVLIFIYPYRWGLLTWFTHVGRSVSKTIMKCMDKIVRT